MVSNLDVNPSISVILPAFNEADNLYRCYTALKSVLGRTTLSYEIFIIDDGSTDDTYTVALKIQSNDHRVHVLSHDKNQGYGTAVRTGLKAAKGDIVFWTDSDGQINFDHLPQALKLLESCDAVLGFRPGRQDGGVRYLFARAGNTLNRLFLDIHAKDIGCAFKLFYRCHVTMEKLTSNGALINTQWLYILQRQKRRIVEIPIVHYRRCKGRPTGVSFKVQWRLWREWLEFLINQSCGRLPPESKILVNIFDARLKE